MKNNDRLRIKRKLGLSSLEAVICNVALFRSMKQREFKDSIFISYNNSGVILEAVNEKQWARANEYIMSFIKSKRIELLTYGYDREVYQNLINKDLKEYTKRLKESEPDCPYINLIHYQRLRKSCEYMDREKYVEPLKNWENKNMQTPNFAYLVVEPKERFDEVKRGILQMLRGDSAPIRNYTTSIKQFLVMFLESEHSAQLKDMFEKKQIDLLMSGPKTISMTIYGDLELMVPEIKQVEPNKRVLRLGYTCIRNETILKMIAEVKEHYKQVADAVVKMHEGYCKDYGNGYCFLVLPKENKAAIDQRIKEIMQQQSQPLEIRDGISKHMVCEWNDLRLLQKLYSCRDYTAWLALINDCYMLVHHYQLHEEDLEGFMGYLDQLNCYYNASLVRFYGVCSRPSNQYMVLLDYRQKSLCSMEKNGEFIDQLQVATVMLQLMYGVSFLHTHDVPRCLGRLQERQVYFPMCFVLPYTRDAQLQCTFDNDVRMIGELFARLVDQPNQHLQSLINSMVEPNSFKRIKMSQAISRLEDIINN